MPAHPRPTTVSTLCPWSVTARSTGSCSSRRTRTSQQRDARKIQRGDGLVALHGRELPQKLVQGFAALEVIEERLYRDACPDEYGRATENLGIAVDDVA